MKSVKVWCAAGVMGAALALTGCGTAPQQTNENVTAAVQAGDKYNETDVMYLQMMVAHHEQGLEMVQIAKDGAKSEEVKTLAAAVEATQADEVKLMKTWLEGWQKPTTVDHAPNAHADHGGLPATGEQEMEALREAKGKSVDPTFLNLFVAHQTNAVEMAKMETDGGANEETKAFADRVRESRTGQIQQMLKLMQA